MAETQQPEKKLKKKELKEAESYNNTHCKAYIIYAQTTKLFHFVKKSKILWK